MNRETTSKQIRLRYVIVHGSSENEVRRLIAFVQNNYRTLAAISQNHSAHVQIPTSDYTFCAPKPLILGPDYWETTTAHL